MITGSAQKVSAKYETQKQRMKHALLKQIRLEWTDKQAVDDTERQLRGEKLDSASELSGIVGQPQHPAQKELVAALNVPAEVELESQYRRRNRAICAIIEYCPVEEGRTRRTVTTVTKSAGPLKEPATDSPLYAAVLSVLVGNDEKKREDALFALGRRCH